jgi:AcrR family transcriptional regulator
VAEGLADQDSNGQGSGRPNQCPWPNSTPSWISVRGTPTIGTAGAPSARVSPAGRPRSPGVDGAILAAAAELLATVGPAGTTINAVARRSGVARASIYLRYPGREALLAAAMRAAIGRAPYALLGEIVTDLRKGAEQARAILAAPQFRELLLMLVGQLLKPDGLEPLTYDMFPNRRLLADEYQRLAADAGLRTDADADQVVDLVGGLLVHLLATGNQPSATAAQAAVDVVLDGLRNDPVGLSTPR